MAAKVFKGVNVFMSRNLVPPELYDTLHDALKLNGASIFLCCDPTRNGPDDYHVISSPDHEKFSDLRLKGCKLIGPQCLLSCAKENRPLPNQGFTCCLGMDGVNILVSGFENEEKADIVKMVMAMGGAVHAKASLDVSFVIAKNVLSQKYKWALNNLKKPIVTKNWLLQCWKEHRVVPQESFRVLPFSGLIISVSGIPGDERMEMEKLIKQNGGRYTADLTNKCTHLVCNAPEGDKYKVAKQWGHIHTVTWKWLHQSIARRGCLNEESYPVQASSSSSGSTLKIGKQLRQGKSIRYSQNTSSSVTTASDSETVFSSQGMDHDQENIPPHMYSTFTVAAPTSKHHDSPPENGSTFDQSVADDSQSEDDDLYLSDCRILLVGFDASRMRALVDMVRRGGGSRYMSFSEKLTHVVVGNPSENESKEVRKLAALGVIHVVKTAWLEECNREKKEVPVLQRHIAYDILLPKDPVFINKATATSMSGVKQGKPSASQPTMNTTQESKNPESEVLVGKVAKEETIVQSSLSNGTQHVKSSTVFKGKLFCFSSSFPDEQRPEIVQWVNEGGGEVVDQNENDLHFIVERHGLTPCPRNSVRCTYVSSHWIHSSLKDGYLLDVGSHILYSPLPCQIPLFGLQGYCFCVSQYDQKERQLLRNLCYVLGVKFIEKLSKKVTHLFCKFADGDKYEAARKWGMQIVTSEWLYECVKQNKVVDLEGFYPKVLTSQDREAGLCTFTQYPSQSIRMTAGDDASRCSSQSQGLSSFKTVSSNRCLGMSQDKRSSSYSKRVKLSENEGLEHAKLHVSSKDNPIDRNKNPVKYSATENTRVSSVPDVGLSSLQTVSSNGCLDMNKDECSSKRVKLSGNDGLEHEKLCDSFKDNSVERSKNPAEDNATENTRDSFVPDVASAIEDLLVQTSKIQDQKSQESSGCHENFMSSSTIMLGQRHADPVSIPEPSKNWMTRLLSKKEDNPPIVAAAKEIYDGFSETQTASQVVGYEEDLSGRQMIIDRVRSSNNSMRTTDY